MKRFIFSLLMLAAVVGAAAQEAPAAVESSSSRYRLSLEAALTPGLNDYAQRGFQVSVVNGLAMGRFIEASIGIGLRHTYTLVQVDKHLNHLADEPDQPTYGDRLLLPLFARIKGMVPAFHFTWLETRFSPYVQFDAGYAVDMQQSVRQRTVSGPYIAPAVGLDMRLKNGSWWYAALGAGFQSAQYFEVDHADGGITTPHTGNAVSFNFTLGYSF